MAEKREFSYIKVNAAEDDIVIQAGKPEEVASPFRPETSVDTAVSEPDGEDPLVGVPVPDPRSGQVSPAATVAESDGGKPAEEAASAPKPQGEPPRPSKGSPGSKGTSWEPTTLDDIEGSKMTMVQKAVIVVALVAIIAFVAWYLVAR